MRALVLGGGGITGIAWELGVVAGLRWHGVDLGRADLIVGTSAGAYVGALLATGVDPETAIASVGAADIAEFTPQVDLDLLAQAFAVMSDPRLSPSTARARLGQLARSAPVGEPQAQVDRFAQRLPVRDWPTAPRLVITAVDAATGEPVAWDAAARVSLVEAVAASCAVPGVFAPVHVGGAGPFMDGGVRSVTNADLAVGAQAVVVIAPTVGLYRPSPTEELRALGTARTIVVTPDPAARSAMGPNILDPTRGGTALAAGATQAATLAEAVAQVWG